MSEYVEIVKSYIYLVSWLDDEWIHSVEILKERTNIYWQKRAQKKKYLLTKKSTREFGMLSVILLWDYRKWKFILSS